MQNTPGTPEELPEGWQELIESEDWKKYDDGKGINRLMQPKGQAIGVPIPDYITAVIYEDDIENERLANELRLQYEDYHKRENENLPTIKDVLEQFTDSTLEKYIAHGVTRGANIEAVLSILGQSIMIGESAPLGGVRFCPPYAQIQNIMSSLNVRQMEQASLYY